MTKTIRERKELENLFADPKYARRAWKAIGQAILLSPAVRPLDAPPDDPRMWRDATIEKLCFDSLSEDLHSLGTAGREVTELEMILHCQAMRARFDTSAAVFIRDTVGARPIDESKLDATIANPYESLSDEDLEALAASRAQRGQTTADTPSDGTLATTSATVTDKEHMS